MLFVLIMSNLNEVVVLINMKSYLRIYKTLAVVVVVVVVG